MSGSTSQGMMFWLALCANGGQNLLIIRICCFICLTLESLIRLVSLWQEFELGGVTSNKQETIKSPNLPDFSDAINA